MISVFNILEILMYVHHMILSRIRSQSRKNSRSDSNQSDIFGFSYISNRGKSRDMEISEHLLFGNGCV